MRPTRHVQVLKGYVHKNLKKNKRPRSHHQVPLQVRQRKPPKMLSNLQLRCSLQAYNHSSSILAIKLLPPAANDMPKSQSCNKWKMTQNISHAPPRQQISRSLCRLVRRRTKRESVLPRATDTTSKGLLQVLSQVCD